MDEQLKAMLEGWLETGTETQARHARFVLAMPDLSPPPPPPVDLHAVPPIVNLDPVLVRIHGCPHHSPGCCHSPAPYCMMFGINPTRDECIACLDGSPPR